ncbi:hypothetical protein F5884DRAFT_830811 [Xylogone sp. PMI_703]|nr:hypothetical protein F5884DRAFT_830811 [Xylogone sp. PMI_703]
MVAPASAVAATAVAVAPLVLGPASSVPIATRAIASIVALAGMGYSIYTFTQQGGLISKKDRPRMDKDIFIPRKQMKELLRYRGKEIYKKLARVHPDYQGTIWSDEDFHIDAGYRVRDRPNYKTWYLLVNRNATSRSAKALRDEVGDKKLFWDVFNLENPADYATWERKILKLFDHE